MNHDLDEPRTKLQQRLDENIAVDAHETSSLQDSQLSDHLRKDEHDISEHAQEHIGRAHSIDTEKNLALNDPGLSPEDTIPDGGWEAWMVVVAFFFSTFNSWGLTNTFGVFQTYYLSQEGPLRESTASTVAWIGSMETFLIFLPGCLVGRLADAGYIRSMNVGGTFIMVFSLMMTSLSTKYYQFFLSQGIGFGLGLCPLFLPAVSVIPHWFKKRRAFAMGIGAAGSSVGGVVYPIAINKLIPMVGFPWSVRIAAFLLLGTQMISIIFLKPRLPARPLRGAAFFDIPSFKEPVYMLLCLGYFLGFLGLYTPFFYVQDFALYHQLPISIVFYLLPIINAASTLGRLLPNFLADKIGCLNMIIPCVTISGILVLIWLACTTLGSLVVFCILFGFFSGAFVSLPPAVIASISKDPKKIGVRVGQSFSMVSVALLAGPPISGAIMSGENGRFTGTAIFAGIVVLFGGFTLIVARLLWSRSLYVKV